MIRWLGETVTLTAAVTVAATWFVPWDWAVAAVVVGLLVGVRIERGGGNHGGYHHSGNPHPDGNDGDRAHFAGGEKLSARFRSVIAWKEAE